MIDEKRAMELYRKGLNDTQIARELGFSQSAIWRWRSRKGLKSHHPHFLGAGKKREKHVLTEKVRVECGRRFKPKRFDQKRCSRCARTLRLTYFVIRTMRYALGEKLLNEVLEKQD